MEKGLLVVDSLSEYEDDRKNREYYDHYDDRHIDLVTTIIDLDELQKAVETKIAELKGQREQSIDRWKGIPEETIKDIEKVENLEELQRRVQGDNPLIKVKVN